MPLQPNAQFTYTGSTVNADSSVTLHMKCAEPGANMPAVYSVTITEAQAAAVQAEATPAARLAALNVLVIAALTAQHRPPTSTIAASLASLPGQAFTVA